MTKLERRDYQAAIAALQIAAKDAVGQDADLQLARIAEWLKRAEASSTEPDVEQVQ